MNEEKLKLTIGTEETTAVLKPLDVVIKSISVETIKVKKGTALKIVCFVLHPDRNEEIKISQIKWEHNGKLEVTGLWLKEGKDGIVRNSALANFMRSHGAIKIEDLIGHTVPTVLDDKNYLVFKGY